MNFIDLFSGVGGFTKGLELAGHKCVGHCEFDKFAEASYRSMHCITEEQRKKLLDMPFKQRQKEILKDEYLNGEWYANDITTVNGARIPRADIWTFGAPCQDFSIAGKRAGLDGKRSGLIREVFRCLEERKEEDRPTWIIYENVKGMLSSNRGLDYLYILSEMDRLGYDVEWQNINSKFFVPQNRERIYTIGHLRGRSGCKVFPVQGTSGKNRLKLLIQGSQGNRLYDSEGISCTLQGEAGGLGAKTGLYAFGIDKSCNKPRKIEIANAVTTKDRGVNNRKAEGTAIAIPVLTPDRANKRQNGRRFKENGKPSFTLTAQDKHGVAIKVREATKKGYATAELGDAINIAVPTSKTRRGRVGKQIAQTLDTSCNQAVVVETEKEEKIWAVWSDKYDCYLAIRKLTPRECFRLQGWEDEYFERAEQFNSNSQLYKQAGNGVTVSVVQAIGEKLKGE